MMQEYDGKPWIIDSNERRRISRDREQEPYLTFVTPSADHNENRRAKSERALRIYKWTKTAIYFFVWVGFGIMCMMGVTLPDFLKRIKIDNEEYGRLRIAENVVGGVAGLFGGMLIDRFQDKSDLIISILLLFFGVSQIALPWCHNQFSALFFMIMINISGFMTGASGTTYVISMWGEHAKLPIHFFYIGFPLGCTLSPLIARPFISEHNKDAPQDSGVSNELQLINCSLNNNSQIDQPDFVKMDNASDSYSSLYAEFVNKSCSNESSANDDFMDDSRIEIPFGMSGGYILIWSVIFMAYHCNIIKTPDGFCLQRERPRSFKDICKPSLWGGSKPKVAIMVYMTLIVFYLLLNAIEGPLTNLFLFTYAVKGQYKFSSTKATYLDTSFKASMLVGRILCIPVIYYCPIKIMIFIEILTSLIASIFLATLGTQNSVALWVFLCVMNFTLSPLWPGGFVWANRYVVLYTTMLAVSDIIIRLSDGFFSWLVGYILEYSNPNDMWYLLTSAFAVLFIVFTIVQLTVNRFGERFVQEKKQEETILHNVPYIFENQFSIGDDEDVILHSTELEVNI